MATPHFRDHGGRPVTTDDVSNLAEVQTAVIDASPRGVIGVGNEGQVNCRACRGDCEHEQQVLDALADAELV